MRLLTVLLCILHFSISSAQKEKVEVKMVKNNGNITFVMFNNTAVQQEVTLSLELKNLDGYQEPVTKLVPAKSSIEAITLTPKKNAKWSYTSNYQYVTKPNKKELALIRKKESKKEKVLAQQKKKQERQRTKALKSKTLKDITDINKGIVVFSKDGCPRCHYTTNYFLDNNIDFKFLNTTENKDYNILMWSLLKENNFKANTVLFPVILVNGKVHTNRTDIKTFIASLGI